MKIKVILLNVLKYTKEGKDSLRIAYVPFDKGALRDESKFKGFTELAIYTDKVEALEQLQTTDFMQEATLTGEEIPSVRDPFRKIMKITEIQTKNATISLS